MIERVPDQDGFEPQPEPETSRVPAASAPLAERLEAVLFASG